MNQEQIDREVEKFWKSAENLKTQDDVLTAIAKVNDSDVREQLYVHICNTMIDVLTVSFDRYNDEIAFADIEYITNYIKAADCMTGRFECYYQALAEFFRGKHEACLKHLKCTLELFDKIDEEQFAIYFIVFKNAFSCFWDRIAEMVTEFDHEEHLPTIIGAVKAYYCLENHDDIADAIEQAMRICPDSMLLNELMGNICYRQKRWHNAIAYYERLECYFTMTPADYEFALAWCFGKIREFESEIQHYICCLEESPIHPYARNNLAYAYYRSKQYGLSEQNYRECIDNGVDLSLACNGYVLALIAQKKVKEAKAFIRTSPVKIRKNVLTRVEEAEKNVTFTLPQNAEAEFTECATKEYARQNTSQFSSEKLLEDELEARLLNGSDVFGIPLKMYRRKGIYGRQMIIPIGRLDLLAEAQNGELYIIELKKDSGYDDAYIQIVQYLDWLESSDICKGKAVHGIICLNSPSKKLTDAVRQDKRVQLFNYHISYSEIK